MNRLLIAECTSPQGNQTEAAAAASCLHYRNLQRVRLIDGTGHLLVRARSVRRRVRAWRVVVVSKRMVVVVVASSVCRQRRTTHFQLLLQVQLDLIAVAGDRFCFHRLQQHRTTTTTTTRIRLCSAVGVEVHSRGWWWLGVTRLIYSQDTEESEIELGNNEINQRSRENKRRPPPAVCVCLVKIIQSLLKESE